MYFRDFQSDYIGSYWCGTFFKSRAIVLIYISDSSLYSCHRMMVIRGEMVMDRRKEYKSFVVGKGAIYDTQTKEMKKHVAL